jgi:hypothetical protein
LQMHIDDLVRSGMPRHEARRVAAVQLGVWNTIGRSRATSLASIPPSETPSNSHVWVPKVCRIDTTLLLFPRFAM